MNPSRNNSKAPGKSAAGRTTPGSENLASLASFVQRSFPQVEVRRKLHHASFLIGGKVFAFTRPEGIVLKLPEERILDLIDSRAAGFLVMGKRTMREWMLLRYANHAECAQDEALLKEALQFVAH